MTKAEQDASFPVDPNLKSQTSSGAPSGPAANLSPVSEATVPVDTSNPNHVDTDPNGLVFSESAFLAGLFNKTHSTSKHGGTKRGDMTKAEQDASFPVDPNLKSQTSSGAPSGPAANLSPVSEATVPVDTSNPNHVDTDPNGLVFSESAFLAEVLDEGDCGVWMAATPNTDGIDLNAPTAPELLAPDDLSSSSSEESQYTPAFGMCMHCNARGYVYTLCNECDDIFHPLQDSSSMVVLLALMRSMKSLILN